MTTGATTDGKLPAALNFGCACQKADEPWRPSVAKCPRANRTALRTIMDHWLRLGVSGFQGDMAYSLVKDDRAFAETARLWREVRPTIYYGDEIGMRPVRGLPDAEGSVMGSGYNRAGSRTGAGPACRSSARPPVSRAISARAGRSPVLPARRNRPARTRRRLSLA